MGSQRCQTSLPGTGPSSGGGSRLSPKGGYSSLTTLTSRHPKKAPGGLDGEKPRDGERASGAKRNGGGQGEGGSGPATGLPALSTCPGHGGAARVPDRCPQGMRVPCLDPSGNWGARPVPSGNAGALPGPIRTSGGAGRPASGRAGCTARRCPLPGGTKACPARSPRGQQSRPA